MCTVGKLDPCGFGRLGGMVGKCQMHCLCPGGPSGWVVHRLKSLAKSGMAKICLALVAIDPIQEGCNFKKLETCVHEVEILDIFFRRHVQTVAGILKSGNASYMFIEIRVQCGQRLAQLIQLCLRAVNFQTVEFRDRQSLLNVGIDILEMG